MEAAVYADNLLETAKTKADSPSAWKSAGLALLYCGRHREAYEAFERTLALDSQSRDAAIARCFALAEIEGPDGGFRAFSNLRTQDFSVIFPLGVYCMRHEWHDTGVEQLLRAEELEPYVPYVVIATACALNAVGETNEAKRRFKKARQLLQGLGLGLPFPDEEDGGDPSSFHGWESPFVATAQAILAFCAVAEGKVDDAEQALQEANARYPGHAQLVVAMGRILSAQGRSDEARRWFSAAVSISKMAHAAYYELSFQHLEKGDLELASEALRTAISLHPLSADYRYTLGTLLRDLGNGDEAIEQFRRAVALDPHYSYAVHDLASAYLDRNEPGEALAVLTEVGGVDSAETVILAAEAHVRVGDRVEAERLLEAVLEVEPSNNEAREALEALKAKA